MHILSSMKSKLLLTFITQKFFNGKNELNTRSYFVIFVICDFYISQWKNLLKYIYNIIYILYNIYSLGHCNPDITKLHKKPKITEITNHKNHKIHIFHCFPRFFS